jgi:hypothetical protein
MTPLSYREVRVPSSEGSRKDALTRSPTPDQNGSEQRFVIEGTGIWGEGV